MAKARVLKKIRIEQNGKPKKGKVEYIVKQTINTTSPKLGALLTELQVKRLIAEDSEVTVVPRK